MDLKDIYKPVKEELSRVENLYRESLARVNTRSISRISKLLLETPGKRLRPALVILSAKAGAGGKSPLAGDRLIKVASSIELIHTASLIHDDVIDHACFRHNKPTVNSRFGQDVSIALGDYLYSIAFNLIATCGNVDVLECISAAAKEMCKGELMQVCERDNISLLKKRYFLILKKKTASLFAASCQAGAMLSNCRRPVQLSLKKYGLNFGIAFQIADDYMDLIGKRQNLGKAPGQDISVGEITLPLLNLLESVDDDERGDLKRLLKARDKDCLKNIKARLLNSDAIAGTRRMASFYLDSGKEGLSALPDSDCKESLFDLADFVLKRGFCP